MLFPASIYRAISNKSNPIPWPYKLKPQNLRN